MATKEEREDRAGASEYILETLRLRAQEIANKDKKRKANAVTTVAAREVLFMDQLSEALTTVFKKKIPTPPSPAKKPKGKTQRILNCILSDTHYGARLDAREVGRNYGPVEEARRTAAVVKQVADYKRQYRNETELYLHIIGDIIQGSLHDARDGAPMAEQIATAMRVLVQAIGYLAHEFPKGMTVFCTTGNHGRNKARHMERGVNQKWDSMEMILYKGLEMAFRDYKNVKFEIPLSPHYTWQAFDQRGFGTHGDTVLNPGFPNRSIAVESVTKQINSINSAAEKTGNKFSLFIVGHVHTGSQTFLASGATLMTNGCLIPSDSYAVSIGIFETACGQWVWESVKGHIVGDSRFIQVGAKEDADASLDAIIEPFKGM